ncbi:hypothetical protein QJS10_CPA06g01016 [Acorus calamus]|uniref:Protein CHUP1, chloroplastic n=1 Tax=Acorus calamus TaxID=4465 RepID=A0AAV9ETJ4_ACOCL|nr:hypothetical protein QJS10_CPA06g01016 [Acorus calamus]
MGEGGSGGGGKREMKPLLLKFGMALALSFAGFIYSQIRSKKSSPLPRLPAPGNRNHGEGLREELPVIRSASPTIDASVSVPPENVSKMIPKTADDDIESNTNDGRTKNNDVADEVGFLLPEFNELVRNEFGRGPSEAKEAKMASMEQEMRNLRNVVKALKERERDLEMHLLEYYGLKEQESVFKELESRLKISTMEAKLFALKVESLQADKHRLESQALDYLRVVSELASARAKIKQLKRKLWSKDDGARQQIEELQERASMLQEQNINDDHDCHYQEVKLKELEEDAEELKRVNLQLVNEKMELERKLESAQVLASSLQEKVPGQEVLDEADRLKLANDDLRKEIDRLQTGQCTDVEELVYLKWINACLRYELRNYQAPPGKTVAKDLSMVMSPKSEEKAKKLILEYANSGVDDKVGFLPEDLDSEYYCSSSRTSTFTESGEFDNSSTDVNSTSRNVRSNKSKFLSKLKNLVLGKYSHSTGHRIASMDRRSPTRSNMRRNSVSMGYFDDMGTYPYDSASSCVTAENTPASNLRISGTQSFHESHVSLMALMEAENEVNSPKGKNGGSPSFSKDSPYFQRLRNLSFEESRPAEADARYSIDSHHHNHSDREPDTPEKLELMKYARVLKNSRDKSKLHRRSASYSS